MIRHDKSGKNFLRNSSQEWNDDLNLRIELADARNKANIAKVEKVEHGDYLKRKAAHATPFEIAEVDLQIDLEHVTDGDNTKIRTAKILNDRLVQENNRLKDIARRTAAIEAGIQKSLDSMHSGADSQSDELYNQGHKVKEWESEREAEKADFRDEAEAALRNSGTIV